MTKVFNLSRYLVLLGVIGLLLAAAAVFVFPTFATFSTIFESFVGARCNAEGARLLSITNHDKGRE